MVFTHSFINSTNLGGSKIPQNINKSINLNFMGELSNPEKFLKNASDMEVNGIIKAKYSAL